MSDEHDEPTTPNTYDKVTLRAVQRAIHRLMPVENPDELDAKTLRVVRTLIAEARASGPQPQDVRDQVIEDLLDRLPRPPSDADTVALDLAMVEFEGVEVLCERNPAEAAASTRRTWRQVKDKQPLPDGGVTSVRSVNWMADAFDDEDPDLGTDI